MNLYRNQQRTLPPGKKNKTKNNLAVKQKKILSELQIELYTQTSTRTWKNSMKPYKKLNGKKRGEMKMK